jgi:mRNA-degrading endonuclease RelE of RelBE toxin-antitoxin system
MYAIRLARDVVKDIHKIPILYRAQIIDAIESQLSHSPMAASRKKKILVSLTPPWYAEPPIWELRVGNYRVFYDVEQDSKTVFIRAVRLKPHGMTTEDVL